MAKFTKEDILKKVEEDGIQFLRLQFTDIFGDLKNVAITASQVEKALDNKIMFDGSSIEGFARIEESDMYLRPDYDTYETFPWGEGKVARLICDVYTTDDKPFTGDPRFVLKQALEEARSMGYELNVGPELEFFLFHMDEKGSPTTDTYEKAGYFDLGTLDLGEDARRDMVLALENMGFEIEASHHEVAPAQHEIDFKYGPALKTADNIQTFKLVVKTIAKKHGLFATFMPKPKFGVCGSGMHMNMSLSKDGKNIFADKNDKLGLSQEAYWFIAGIMEHMKEMTAITNPLVNSYKRLVPGYEAPIYIAWSAKNRSPLVRIPSARGEGTRVELRCPDPTANPYLAMAVCLRAGLDGIKRKLAVVPSVDTNIFELTKEEKKARHIHSLPANLREATLAMMESEFVKEAVGEHIFNRYTEAKMEEWNDYTKQVTEWEISRYLYRV